MNKQFLAILLVIFIALFGVFTLTKDKEDNGSNNSNTSVQPSNHVKGKTDSKVTLTEYGDFQCPACKSYYPIVKELSESYGDKVQFQFRHFPLVQIHPNAFVASRAAEAAGKQNKFFEMHDQLYENQDIWSTATNPNSYFEGYASQLGLNLDQFKSDMTSEAVSDQINADLKAGQALKANSTPTFAINGKKIEKNPQSIDEFKKLLDDELSKNQ